MVYCCVPQCGTDSWRCDPSITFHDFPSSPDLAAKWIKQINNAIKADPMWFPRGKAVVCSKHFLSTDFRDDSDALKPRVIPTIFGCKYIGPNPEVEEVGSVVKNKTTGPLIVKIKTEDGSDHHIVISDIPSQNDILNSIINEPENSVSQAPITTSSIQPTDTTLPPNSTMGVKHHNYQSILMPSTAHRITNNPSIARLTNNSSIVHSTNITPSTAYITNNTPSPTYATNNTPSTEFITNTTSTTTYTTNNTPSLKPTSCSTSGTSNENTKLNATNKTNKTQNTEKRSISKGKNPKNKVQKRDNNDNNLIEIGPNTFLKINPDIIKVNKKQTPSGNTVLQFLMDQKLANTIGADVLPKIVQGAISNIGNAAGNLKPLSKVTDPMSVSNVGPVKNTEPSKTAPVVQHVLGHLVDTHVCKEQCAQLEGMDDMLMETDEVEQSQENNSHISVQPFANIQKLVENASNVPMSVNGTELNKQAEPSCIAKAPVLLTTNMPLAHCFMEKTKYLTHLRQKARQIATLKQKVASLNKKIEELEDKCVVQERQLSFSFLKRLRTIRKNASKGDPPATYILEQIRAYTGQKQMRWSDSTLQQCGIWCRKAPYAYEYFKKADFFKLPCLGTVKRFMKKHPEMTFSSKSVSNTGKENDGSSSDFNFDDDSMDETQGMKDIENDEIECETMLTTEPSDPTQADENSYHNGDVMNQTDKENNLTSGNTIEVVFHDGTEIENGVKTISAESKSYPITVDGNSLEIQELILSTGEVIQCYASDVCDNADGSQYYIIPSSGDPGADGNHEISIVQSADSVPLIFPNLENSQGQQEQLIVITNSSDQVECTETEVSTAR